MGEIQQVGNIVLAPGRPPGHGEGANRIPVPGLPPGDNPVLSGIAGCDVVLPGDFHGRLCGFGPSGNKEDPVQVSRREVGDPVRQVDLGLGEEPGVGETDLLRLFGHDFCDLFDSVADTDHMHARTGVEIVLSFRIEQVNAFSV